MPTGIYPRQSIKDRFEIKITKGENEYDCWEWLGKKEKQGYGVLGRSSLAHRIAYELFIGPIAKNYQVNHKCNSKSCCNPKHLYLGSQKENIQDKIPLNKNEDFIQKVKELHHQGLSNVAIGKQLNKTGQYIGRIISGKQYISKNLIKKDFYEKQKGICNGCKEWTHMDFVQIDHIIPKSRGGSNGKDNLQILCFECNILKSNKDMDYLFWRLLKKNNQNNSGNYISDEQVQCIKQLYNIGWKCGDIAIEYNTHETTIYKIINNKRRLHPKKCNSIIGE